MNCCSKSSKLITVLLFFSLREVVAKFLTDYCCSPRPLKAANVRITAFLVAYEREYERESTNRIACFVFLPAPHQSHFECTKISKYKSLYVVHFFQIV